MWLTYCRRQRLALLSIVVGKGVFRSRPTGLALANVNGRMEVGERKGRPMINCNINLEEKTLLEAESAAPESLRGNRSAVLRYALLILAGYPAEQAETMAYWKRGVGAESYKKRVQAANPHVPVSLGNGMTLV
jgi:hypothetical protein